MKEYVIKININQYYSANCLFAYTGIVDALRQVKEIIDNYNKNLANMNSFFDLLSLRILEEETMKGDSRSKKPIMREHSYEFLRNEYSNRWYTMIDPKTVSWDVPRIGLYDDIVRNEKEADYSVIIDFDENLVIFDKMIKRIVDPDYEKLKKNKIDIKKFNTINSNLKMISFNEIENALEFIEDNPNGWIESNLSVKVCCIPY